MSDCDESKLAWKSFLKMGQPVQPNKFDTFKKPDESVMNCARCISNDNNLDEPKSLYMNLVTPTMMIWRREQFCNTWLQGTLD